MNRSELRVTWLDRLLLGIAPRWAQRRIEARTRVQLMERNFDAAKTGRRTSGWNRRQTDANAAAINSLAALRELSRDLRRNNGWARRGIQVIANNTVSWGIMPRSKVGRSRVRSQAAIELWNDWAEDTCCDFDGRMNFYGLQQLAMQTIAESGEVLIVRQAPAGDETGIPMRIQVLEPDYLDSNRNGIRTEQGNLIIGGVEIDKRGRRVAYWMFSSHPGAMGQLSSKFVSERIPADRVLHIFHVERPGQVRGIPWLASAIARLNDLEDLDDAELIQQKVAACFGAFVTDVDGAASAIGKPDDEDDELEHLEPGHIAYLPPGKSITFAQPPSPQAGMLSTRSLRRIAASLGVTYEDLTGDYSQVNFSSARMARIAHWQNVGNWREHMLIPQLCNGVWKWAMKLAQEMEGWAEAPCATWSAPPMPLLEPDKEGLAYQRLVRNGVMTLPQAIRELGFDPIEQLDEIEQFNTELDKRGIVLDLDPRKMTTAGQAQAAPKAPADAEDTADAKDPADAAEDPAADPEDAADAAEPGDSAEDAADGADPAEVS